MFKKQKVTTEQVVEKYIELGGNMSETARALDVSRGSVQHHIGKAGLTKPVAGGTRAGRVKTIKEQLPVPGDVRRFIVSCAQNNTKIHDKLWQNIQALAKYHEAEIKISRITYNTSAYTAQPEKPGKAVRSSLSDPLWYDPAITDYLCDDRVELAPGLVFCGELNILPTAARPLSDLEAYTGRASAIVPHTKLAMESVASGKHEATKFNYTTGTVTMMSYIQRKAGQKAEFHHCYGALLVEVDGQGRWFVRQLNADKRGVIYDLDLKVENGRVTKGNWTFAVNWGDIHEDELDEEVRELAWAKGGMMDVLRPQFQFMHDALNFGRRNHHDRKDCHKMFQKHIEGRDSVQDEIMGLVRFLNEESYRPYCKTIVVNSNHDNAVERWLREADYRRDPPNALYFLKLQHRKYQAIADEDHGFYIVEWAAKDLGCKPEIQWLREDEDFVRKGIKFDMHGHLGLDGSRGYPRGFARMGHKANTGHTHKAGIVDGVYTAGTSSILDLGYNRGPSSWSHSHIVTYENSKRCIVTMWQGAWRAL